MRNDVLSAELGHKLLLELIRGRTGSAYGQLMALLTICKGLPIGYNRDLQEDKRCVFAAYDLVIESLAMAARIVASVAATGECSLASSSRVISGFCCLIDRRYTASA